MAHFKRFPQMKKEDKITYGNGIVEGIVNIAMAEVPFTELYSSKPHKKTQTNAISVKYDKEGLFIEVQVKIHFSQCVSEVAFKIQETVRHSVESMTDYKVSNVNVIVNGVLFDELDGKTVLQYNQKSDSDKNKKSKKTLTKGAKSDKPEKVEKSDKPDSQNIEVKEDKPVENTTKNDGDKE